jgi:Lar family restriction alleviation protein
MADVLKSCPFCGSGVAKEIGNASFSGVELMCGEKDRPYVWCGTCGSSGSFEDTEAEAIAAWNRRAAQHTPEASALAARLDDVRQAYGAGLVSVEGAGVLAEVAAALAAMEGRA